MTNKRSEEHVVVFGKKSTNILKNIPIDIIIPVYNCYASYRKGEYVSCSINIPTNEVLIPGKSQYFVRRDGNTPHPMKTGILPHNIYSNYSKEWHVLGNNLSNFISASLLQNGGAKRFTGKPFWIKISILDKHGKNYYYGKKLFNDLEKFIDKEMKKDKQYRKTGAFSEDAITRAQKRAAINYISFTVDKEVVIEGPVPAEAVRDRKTMNLIRANNFVFYIGIGTSAWNLEKAAEQSIQQKSFLPFAKQTVLETGGWAGGWAGAETGAAFGASIGIETGPGAIVTGAVGAILGAALGATGASYLIRRLNW